MSRRHLLIVAAAVVAGCNTTRSSAYPPGGDVLPTVSGASGATFADAASARNAFTRSNDTMTAALEDSAWLRFEGAPDTVAARHRAYFDYGYTTFRVDLYSKTFTQPVKETYVLEDSAGARFSGSPTTWTGSGRLEGQRYVCHFDLSFPHVLTRDVKWLRLTRTADGGTLEWTFGSPPAPAATAPPVAPAGPVAPAPVAR